MTEKLYTVYMKASNRAEKALIRRLAKFLISEDEYFEGRRDSTPEEWFLETESNGISPDFSDNNFTIWFVGKCRQEFGRDSEMCKIARKFFSMKILDPVSNAVHRDLLAEMLVNDVLGDREWYKLVGDYCIRNFRETEIGKMALKFAKAFGITGLTYEEIYGVSLFESVLGSSGK